MSFKAGETITEYKVSNKTEGRQPMDKFIDQMAYVDEEQQQEGQIKKKRGDRKKK